MFLTSKKRDNETGLDYFLARYYSSAQGRFINTDPLLESGRPIEPQSWNRYAYVLNNPLRFIAPDGLEDAEASSNSDDQEEQRRRRTIYIFLTFTRAEQQTPVSANPRSGTPAFTIPAPNFQSLVNNAPASTNVQLIQGASATGQAFTQELQDPNSAGVIFIGHAQGNTDPNGVFQATGLVLADGTFAPQGGIQTQAENVCISACDSQDLRGFFNFHSQNQSFIGVDSGSNGFTSSGALSRAGFAVAQALINQRGLGRATAAANRSLTPRTDRTLDGKPIILRRDPLDMGDRVLRLP